MVLFSWINSLQPILLLVIFCTADSKDDEFHCSRQQSRIVRDILRKDFFPVYEGHNSDPNKNCPLHESHDAYIDQEINKVEEHSSRWKCNFCGKLFYSEQFLDKHFDNRHQNHLIKGARICLADYCDIFRCDFLSDYKRDTFWEKALCNEDKLSLLRKRCEVLLHSCLPEGNLSNDTEYIIYESTRTSICSLLTCKEYWKPPHDEIPPWKIILYAVFTPFFIIALILYYYSAWEYYFGDLFQDTSSEMEERSPRYVRSWQRDREIRNRFQSRQIHMY